MPENSPLLVTGGAGFIGSNFVRAALRRGLPVVTLDKLTYAGHRENLAGLDGDVPHDLVEGDIADRPLVARLLQAHRPRAIVHFAAESHVDRSIDRPAAFVQTNVVGTFELLDAALRHWQSLDAPSARAFRFLHVSTDEVFGALGPDGAFTEASAHAPNSPYAASKAAADHFVRAMHVTYGLPTLTTFASNNYGPAQFPEKLIPLTILNALEGKPLPVYGDGQHVRDWLYVEDHCEALFRVLEGAAPGAAFVIGARAERANVETVAAVCRALDRLAPRRIDRASNDRASNDGASNDRASNDGASNDGASNDCASNDGASNDGASNDDPSNDAATGAPRSASYADLITFVEDRPGHDRRYAIEPGLIERTLGWTARTPFDRGIEQTVRWYIEHRDWCRLVSSRERAGERLGLRLGARA